MSANIIQIIDAIYIVSVVLFILAIKWLSSPATARHGILAGEIGAALALGATLCDPQVEQYKWILVALVVGAGIGIPLGMVKMTAVPQRTALSHAFGALSASLAVLVFAAGFCVSGAQTGLNAFAPGCYPTIARATGVSWMLGMGRFGSIGGSLVGGAL